MLRQKISALHVPRHASSAKKSEHGGEQIKLPKPSSLEQSFPDFPGRGLKVWMHFTNRWIQDIPDLVHVLAAAKIFPCQKKVPEVTVARGIFVCPWIKQEMKYSSHPMVFRACKYFTARPKGGGSQSEPHESIANPKQNPKMPQKRHMAIHVSVCSWMAVLQSTIRLQPAL